MKYLNRIFVDLVSLKWILFGLVTYYFGLSLKKSIIINSFENQSPFNQWDFMILFLGDPYLVIYFIFPIWIFYSNLIILKNRDLSLLIRLGGYRKWIFYTLIKASEKLTVIIIIWITISLILTLNIPYEIGWSKFSTKITDTDNIINILYRNEFKPFFGVFMQVILFTLFTLTIHILSATIFVVFQKKSILISLNVIVSLGMIVSFKVIIEGFKKILLPNYIFLNHTFLTFHSFVTAPIILFIIILGCLLIVIHIDKSDLNKVKYIIKSQKKYLIYISLCLLGIISPVFISDFTIITVWDNLYIRFFGFSEQGFKFSHYIYSCIVFLGFIFLYQLKLNDILTEQLYYVIIRYKSTSIWFFHFIKDIVIRIPILLLLILFSLVVTGLFSGQIIDLKITVGNYLSVNQVLYHFFINGFFQLLNYYLIIFIVSWISKDVFPSLIAVTVIMLAMTPMVNKGLILPFGLNSLGYVTGNFHDILQITITLIIYNIFELFIILYLFKKRDILF